MSDPDIPLQCWACGRPLTYLLTLPDGRHLYVCSKHGRFRLTPAGLEPDDTETVH